MSRKPLGKVRCEWTAEFAYAIGLIATDGNLSPDGRHINFTSKDAELAELFRGCLGIQNTIGKKSRGISFDKKYFVVQFGDVKFYRFLMKIGLTPRKSKTMAALDIPRPFFYDFLRGCIDGDGTINAFRHPESRHPQLRVRIVSASRPFLEWIQQMTRRDGIGGHIGTGKRVHVLAYAITDSLNLLARLYHDKFDGVALGRKYVIAKKFMRA